MLGYKPRNFKTHTALTLEKLVPPKHFYRQVEAKLDLGFVRELVSSCYAKTTGRPSIDPVIFFKLHLIMFFEGIRSERQLMEQVAVNLAFRWYIGYDLDETVPNHSSLSKIRERYGVTIFLHFFEKIVDLCREAGLVWGRELYFDGTKVRANAAIDRLQPRLTILTYEHVEALFAEQPASAELENSIKPVQVIQPVQRRFIDKYDGKRLALRTRLHHWYARTTDTMVSPTDPHATPMKQATDKSAKLGYHTHYVVDGGKARIILAALVTPASVMDNTPMLDLVRWVRFRWQLQPHIAVGDTRYGTTYNIVGLEQDGIAAYLPTPDFSQRTKFYSNEMFQYDAARNLYICPNGQELRQYSRRAVEHVFVYRGDAEMCNACPLKSACTNSRSGKHVFRSFYQEYLDRAQSYQTTEPYLKAMRKRQVWVEPLFGEGKQWHGMAQFRLRGLLKVNMEALLRAAGQNIKRLIKAKQHVAPLNSAPAGVSLSEFMALPLNLVA